VGGEFSSAPYPGMRPFRADESDIYFGREAQTDALLDKLARHRFLAVVGPSGCGKSSLVRAGMIAALQTGFMAAAGADWRVAEMRPGDRPMARLANVMMRAVGGVAKSAGATAPLVEACLRRGPLGLVDLVHDGDLPPATNLLLLVDQFEEIFRYHQKGGSDEADAFVGLLLASAAQTRLPIYVVITMRSDFLGDCALFSGLPEAINDSQYLTPRLSREQCRLAISGPARVFGGTVAPALVNRLLNEFGPNPDQLPLLQHALMRMWDSARRDSGEASAGVTIGLAHYERIGGLARAMSDHADEVLDELSSDQSAIAEVMFRRLTERGIGQRDTRAPARLSDVAAVAGVAASAVCPVVDAFRRPDRSFLTPPADIALNPETLLDIGHESLIRQWQTLGEWVDRETRSAGLYRRLGLTSQLWLRGEAALWRNPDLERALKWEVDERPTPAWAVRYGSVEEFAQAIAFLRESETVWLGEQARAEQAARREREQEIVLQTQNAEQEKLRAENAALRSHKRLLSTLFVLLPLLAMVAGLAFWQMNVAEEARLQAEEARLNAEEARQKAEQQAKQVQALLARLTNSEAIKRAFLAEDGAAIARFAQAAARNDAVVFAAEKKPLTWKTEDDRSLFNYRLFPLPATLRGPLNSATQITYFMNHPTFQKKLITAGPADHFVGSYIGWGCLDRVYALVEFADPDRLPEVYEYDMCAQLSG
jgi:mannitol/fructose-specific phosphotransferase system IIA component (Ntr-type)